MSEIGKSALISRSRLSVLHWSPRSLLRRLAHVFLLGAVVLLLDGDGRQPRLLPQQLVLLNLDGFPINRDTNFEIAPITNELTVSPTVYCRPRPPDHRSLRRGAT